MVAQWLLGNELKQVQLKFLYGVHKTLYDTAARKIMIDDTKNQCVLQEAIPCMTVFKTMQNILAIQQRKAEDKIREEERQKRKAVLMAETGMTFDDEQEEEEPKEEEDKKKKGKGKKKEVEVDPEELERRKAEAAKKKDIATYGRTWIWEEYHEEKEEINAVWMAGQDSISRINVQVLEDIEDVIVMMSFKEAKLSHKQI